MTTPIANIPQSTVPAVKQYLVDIITANVTADADNGIPWVGLDEPGTTIPWDIISIRRTRNRVSKPTQMVGSGGPGWIFESYEIDVECSSARGGDERVQPDVVARAWALASLVEACVRSDPSLGGLVIVANPAMSTDESQPDLEHKGRVFIVTTTIAVTAQI